MAREYVDGKGTRFRECSQRGGGLPQTPQNHRRLERDGAEAIGSNTDIAGLALRGDDRHARCKRAQRTSQR